ncbi:MAG: hydrogen peroxide-inducible genes activator [Gluconacetobacter diazotrophicus]|nr:hydrogen peroxide-inducible genes activator [Gluconacetobacter diazotrophicus]
MNGISLRELQYALAVAELGHFGRAAERCGVSQPALSEQLRKLENSLGLTLFERGRGGAHPTRAGEPVLKQAAAVMREADALLRMARAGNGALDGPVELGVIPTLGPYYVPTVLRSLRDAFPALQLRLREDRTGALVEALRRFALDAALVALPVAEGSGLGTAPLFFEPFRVMVPAGHALEQRDAVAVAELDGRELLLLDEGHCLRDQAVALCRVPAGARGGAGAAGTAGAASTAGATGAGGAERVATSLEMLRHMVAAREGIALMPALATGSGAAHGTALNGMVSLRPLRDAGAGRTVGLVWRDTDPRAAEFTRLAAALREKLPEGVAGGDPAGTRGAR